MDLNDVVILFTVEGILFIFGTILFLIAIMNVYIIAALFVIGASAIGIGLGALIRILVCKIFKWDRYE